MCSGRPLRRSSEGSDARTASKVVSVGVGVVVGVAVVMIAARAPGVASTADARTKTLSTCADLVRREFPSIHLSKVK